ncbi:uncharacterized protein [Ptychodera flava]|uniref:uncharacterized protein isoform X1 n=1 Tax=Ptychodera flava TaxID=63121 RepID=UPI003969D8EA
MGRLVISVTLCIALSSIDLPLCSSSEARPQWKIRPENVNARVGDDVSLNCSFYGLKEDGPSPRWDHRGENGIYRMISDGNESYDPRCEITGDFSGGEYNMLIRNVTFEEAGVWKCFQMRAIPKAQKATLTVMEKGGEESGSQTTASPSYSVQYSFSHAEKGRAESVSGSQTTASPSYSVVVAQVVTIVTLFGFALF